MVASTSGLFSPTLISPTIAASLPPSYEIRPLRKEDYARGFLDCLRVLTQVGEISEEKFNAQFEWMNTSGKDSYYVVVIDNGDRIVGTGALLVERKL